MYPPLQSDAAVNCGITRHGDIFADIDEKLDKRDLTFVKISDEGAGEAFGIDDLPSLVYFENGVPELFEGKISVAFKMLV